MVWREVGYKESEKMMQLKTRVWCGHEVDIGLDNDWLIRLNNLPKSDLISICAGHIEYTDDNCPSFNLEFDYEGPNTEVIGLKLKKELENENTKVDVDSWAGPYGNWVTRVNGKYRKGVFSAKDLHSPIKSVVVCVDSLIPNTPENKDKINLWWDRSIKIVEGVLGNL